MQHLGEVLRRNNFAVLADCSEDEKKRDMKKEALEGACEEYLACLFTRTINQERYGPLKTKLTNDWAFREDSYPKTVAKAFQLIKKWKDEHGSKSSKGKTGDDEEVRVGFVQQRLPKAAKVDVDCYGCGKKDTMAGSARTPPRKRKKPSLARRQKGNKPSRPERLG